MAYADHKENKAAAIGSAILIQAGIGAALFTGLVVTTTTKQKDPPLPIEFVSLPPLPPEPVPEPEPVAMAARPETPQPRINVPVPVVRTPSPVDLTTTTAITPILPPVLPPAPEPRILRVEPPVSPAVDLSRALAPRGNVGAWFPQDSYPPAARRAGAEGRVTVSLDVGTDGRVTGCRVVASSGNGDLDGATCRLATRNGRFAPSLDANGTAVPGTLRLPPVRWTLED